MRLHREYGGRTAPDDEALCGGEVDSDHLRDDLNDMGIVRSQV